MRVKPVASAFFLVVLCLFLGRAQAAAEPGLPAPSVSQTSPDIILPRNKEGVADPGYSGPQPSGDVLAARYQVFSKQMDIGIRIYNMYWSDLEGSGTPSSAQPIDCKAGYFLVPKDEQERKAEGYNRFRCIKQQTAEKFDGYLGLDAKNGIQSAAVLWSTPPIYRYPDCSGAGWTGKIIKDGCVPRDDAMLDFEDYVNFLATRYNGGPNGKITNFVIWNENDSPTWFNYSPVVQADTGKTRNITDAEITRVVNKYASMMKVAYKAITRHTKSMMLYASTDQLWDVPVKGGSFSSKVLLEKLWDSLGTSIGWSVAVHPYGYPLADNPKVYTFKTLPMVEAFQAEQLHRRGITEQDVLKYPQAYLFASEQGWQQKEGIDKQARNVCLSYDFAMKMPYVVGITNNLFQANAPEPGNQFFGLVPFSIPHDLSTVSSVATGQAYLSTRPDLWGKSNDHYCCKDAGVGCAAH